MGSNKSKNVIKTLFTDNHQTKQYHRTSFGISSSKLSIKFLNWRCIFEPERM
jgi:hypothetical protein